MVLRTGLGLVGVGTAVGTVAGFALARTLSSVLFGVGATDPRIFAAVTLGLVGLAVAAVYRPARQAAGIDPASLLREE